MITGASSGIGLELARKFAAEGYDLIVTADNGKKLRDAARQIRTEHPDTGITLVVADLAEPDGARALHRQVKAARLNPDVLVNNAGAGVWGDFPKTDLEDELDIIQLNTASVVAITKLFVPAMIKRRSGKILFTASVASLAPTPLLTVYGATKAFVYSFSQALGDELDGTGVTVTALLPGATDTNFFKRAGAEHTQTAQGDLADPERVAHDAYDTLMKGHDHVITPTSERLMAVVSRFMPDRMVAHQNRIE
ncbi:MAG TPA: SDR family oxidoreductase [Xanthobacteraceae bacterium]|nr:SDR family oxidoreductase [Xanthobacteraceae bacterium]